MERNLSVFEDLFFIISQLNNPKILRRQKLANKPNEILHQPLHHICTSHIHSFCLTQSLRGSLSSWEPDGTASFCSVGPQYRPLMYVVYLFNNIINTWMIPWQEQKAPTITIPSYVCRLDISIERRVVSFGHHCVE